MRRALVSAQGSLRRKHLIKPSSKSQQIVDEAKVKYEMRVKELKAEIAAEEQRLELAKKNNADFLSKMTAVYDAQKKILVKLAAAPELQPTEPRDEDDTAMSIPTLSADIQEAVAPQTSVQADDKMPHVPRKRGTARRCEAVC